MLKGSLLRNQRFDLAEIQLVRDFMHVLITCKFKKDQIKSNRENVETSFSLL